MRSRAIILGLFEFPTSLCWNLPQPYTTCSNMRANEVVSTWQTRLYIWPPTTFFIENQSFHDFQHIEDWNKLYLKQTNAVYRVPIELILLEDMLAILRFRHRNTLNDVILPYSPHSSFCLYSSLTGTTLLAFIIHLSLTTFCAYTQRLMSLVSREALKMLLCL